MKYGVILDPEFFAWLEDHAASLLARQGPELAYAVERSAALKAGVVEQDERETFGLRAVLNYGHTFAHAYETATGYGTLLHGEAVAIGMADAAELAVRLGRIPAEIARRQDALLTALHLPVRLPSAPRPSPEELVALMARDKKTLHGKLRFILSKQLGEVELVEGIDPSVVLDVLARIA